MTTLKIFFEDWECEAVALATPGEDQPGPRQDALCDGLDRYRLDRKEPPLARSGIHRQGRPGPRDGRQTFYETAYYLLIQALSPERLNTVLRSHWQIGSRLHWRLDVVMTRLRTEPASATPQTISPYSATWRSTPCKRRVPEAPSAVSSSEQAGMTTP
jgi:hypothetical protein